MRVERSAHTERHAQHAFVRHFDSRIARQNARVDGPYEATLLYDVKFKRKVRLKLLLLSNLGV